MMSNECNGPEYVDNGCGHDLASDDPVKGHVDRGGALVCKECFQVCRTVAPVVASPVPPPTVTPSQQTPQDVEGMARAVAMQVSKIRNEMIWKDLQRPGVIIRAVDGGFVVENRYGEEAARFDVDKALEKAKEWLQPPKV